MYGGYGPFSSNWGLGVDQIVAATVLDASGAIVEADKTLLKSIRGAGGAFGIILDVTIRIYPLKAVSLSIPMCSDKKSQRLTTIASCWGDYI